MLSGQKIDDKSSTSLCYHYPRSLYKPDAVPEASHLSCARSAGNRGVLSSFNTGFAVRFSKARRSVDVVRASEVTGLFAGITEILRERRRRDQ